MDDAITRIYKHKVFGQSLWEMLQRQFYCVDQNPDEVQFEPSLIGITDFIDSDDPEEQQYFYHPDHLGSSSFITDASGDAHQHLQYLPFGEDFISQRIDWQTRYTFSAKEKDKNTGYHYFGARYYDSEVSVWLSVDPLSDERSWISPYNYVQWNPLNRVDPNGNTDFDDWFINGKGEIKYFANKQADFSNTKTKETWTRINTYSSGIQVYDAADENGSIPDAVSHMDETFEVGDYTIVPYFVKIGEKEVRSHYVAYCVVKNPITLEETPRFDYIFGMEDLGKFMKIADALGSYANLMFGKRLHLMNSQINYLNSRSLNAILEYLYEQYTNPFNYIDVPLNLKTTKPKNAWHSFNRKMGKGRFTKSKYGNSSSNALEARKKAYKDYKKKHGY